MKSIKFQRLASNKMFFHSLDDLAIQFEMAMVMDGYVPTDGQSDGKADAGNALLQREVDAL